MKIKTLVCTIAVCALFFSLNAEIGFSSPDINNRNEVLFSIKADIPGGGSYDTLFVKELDNGKMDQLTFYPEAMESLSNGRILQVRNRFGTGRYDTVTNSFQWIDDYKPFVSGGSPGMGILQDVSPSPDGRWQVSIEPTSPAYGRLVLYDVTRSFRYILAPSVERGSIPVVWSPDSAVLIYSVNNSLYFARPESFFTVSAVSEQYRILGPGTINCVTWYAPSRFLYISGKNIYRVQVSELFARNLYSPLLGPGELAGKLPFNFEASADTFCAAPDGSAILYGKDCRNVYYCPLDGDDYVSVRASAQMPYLLLPGNTAKVMPAWTSENIPLVFAESIEDGKRLLKVWRLVDFSGGKIFSPVPVPAEAVTASVSRDGTWVAFIGPRSIQVYSPLTWKEIAVFRDEVIVSTAWADDSHIFIGGNETIRNWNFRTNTSIMLMVSAVAQRGWDEQGTTVIADVGTAGRFSYAGKMKWTLSPDIRIRPVTSANQNWRLYLDSSKGYYSNMLFVRSAAQPGGTGTIVREPDIVLDKIAPAGTVRQVSDKGIFSHGSRTGLRQVALVFDAMDTLDGLPEILHVLHRYNIRATFFINGEFIRRHPAAVNEIAKAGHQTASLFFSTWDLSGTQYRIDEDFIIRGLSRNEDDFYNATGQELTLLWHAPFYVASPMIIAAGEKAGYRYISPDITVLDWVTSGQKTNVPGLYKKSAEIIEDVIAEKKPGSIIPVRIGKPGGRDDYLFDKTDLLINALVEAGYSIVTVDTLIQNAR
ncbi:polysaccharide deacetylase family protein [Brucepastera parasyntrophica]|uniref:polysaccharide deacetylase family protein n=1 Tax=Brucepastera parasyntrophica TaxID=2880008 RepID=UPI00210ECAEE|nr:polysaccharide deacetylase family protein [Brucepastera parasyntrophica]ULQ59417.1 polysaccharide deacetylase family protein [Brucepastera parasyntrophica]